jgi:aminoglycoside phosphotransferase (APT) family kinase protein
VSEETVFQGGVNVVRRRGDVVHRPANECTPTLHRLLTHLQQQGFDGAPLPLGFDDEGAEVLTYVEGAVHESLTPELRTPRMLTSTATLLRRMHDASATYERTTDDQWLLPARAPAEVICHGDIAPYNSAEIDGQVVGFIDFDTAYPGPRLWDVAYAVYRFAPLHAPDNPDSAGSPTEQAALAAGFCRAYGIPADRALLDAVVERLDALITFMRDRAAAGDAAFRQHIADGHAALYEADVRYVREQADVMSRVFAETARDG